MQATAPRQAFSGGKSTWLPRELTGPRVAFILRDARNLTVVAGHELASLPLTSIPSSSARVMDLRTVNELVAGSVGGAAQVLGE